ncbi:hypothetical protein CEQ90_12510 [Lewinellaceae bacterium SD302]|nr:hypothetical protein CEQ90_12510 [Lewinellaceae bacterium SD302]
MYNFKYLFTCLLLIAITTLSAQSRSRVQATMTEYDNQTMASQEITINASQDEVEESWDDFWSDRYDVDVDKADKNRNSITYKSEAAEVSALSNKTMDIYSKLTKLGDNRTGVSLALSFGYDLVATAEKYPDEYQRASTVLDDFQTYFYKRHYDEKIEELRDQLNDVRDDREDAADDQSKASKKIRKYQDKIKKLEEKIADAREEIGEESITEEEKMMRVKELEEKMRMLERERRAYVN